MPKDTRKAIAKHEVLTRPALAKFLRTQGASLNATDGEPLRDFARWLINSNIEKFNGRIDMSNAEIIRVLGRFKFAGAPREVVKSWLVTRLFDRTEGTVFRAIPKDRADLVAARELMAADEAETGVKANRALLEAVTLFAKGEVESAYVKYDEMRQALRGGEYVGPHTQGVLSMRPLAELAAVVAAGGASPRAPIQFAEGHFAQKRPIVVIGVDPVYHDRYAARMVASVNGAFNVHFHVCNPGEVKLIAADNVRYSFENNPDAAAPFYATMRFLALRQILQTYDAPLMTLDADSVSSGSVAGLFDILPDYDVALNTSKDARGVLPWRLLIAQVFAVNPTEAAREFLRSFEAQFDHLMAQDGSVSWYVDQALLTSTLFLTQQRQPETRLLVRGLSRLSGTMQSK